MLVVVDPWVADHLEVRFHHFFHERGKVNLALPSKQLLGFCRVPVQQVDFGRTVIPFVHPHDGLAGLDADAHFFVVLAFPAKTG